MSSSIFVFFLVNLYLSENGRKSVRAVIFAILALFHRLVWNFFLAKYIVFEIAVWKSIASPSFRCFLLKMAKYKQFQNAKNVNGLVLRLKGPYFWTTYDKVIMDTFNWQNLNQIPEGQVGRVSWFHMEWHETISLIYSGEIVDLKILQSDWLRAFWPISQEQNFYQHRICAGTQQII